MGPTTLAILRRLSDGAFHSGESIARDLELSRTAVWKHVTAIRNTGLVLESAAGRGYRIPGGLDLLDPARIRKELPAAARQLPDIELFPTVDSTNRWLYGRALDGAPQGSICLAEMQTAGRGRRGRGWVSPFAANLYLSMLWRFDLGPTSLGGLSLAIGVAVVRALESLGIEGAGLKWPNDLYWSGRKLAGVLVEVSGESEGPCLAVAGIGINCRMPPAAAAQVDQPFAQVADLPGAQGVGRNAIAAALIGQLQVIFTAFEVDGFNACRGDFDRLDLLRGQLVRIVDGAREVQGTALGVDDWGRLRAELPDGPRLFANGEVSLRMLA